MSNKARSIRMSDLDWKAATSAALTSGYTSTAAYVMRLLYDDPKFRAARLGLLEAGVVHQLALAQDEQRSKT